MGIEFFAAGLEFFENAQKRPALSTIMYFLLVILWVVLCTNQVKFLAFARIKKITKGLPMWVSLKLRFRALFRISIKSIGARLNRESVIRQCHELSLDNTFGNGFKIPYI